MGRISYKISALKNYICKIPQCINYYKRVKTQGEWYWFDFSSKRHVMFTFITPGWRHTCIDISTIFFVVVVVVVILPLTSCTHNKKLITKKDTSTPENWKPQQLQNNLRMEDLYFSFFFLTLSSLNVSLDAFNQSLKVWPLNSETTSLKALTNCRKTLLPTCMHFCYRGTWYSNKDKQRLLITMSGDNNAPSWVNKRCEATFTGKIPA